MAPRPVRYHPHPAAMAITEGPRAGQIVLRSNHHAISTIVTLWAEGRTFTELTDVIPDLTEENLKVALRVAACLTDETEFLQPYSDGIMGSYAPYIASYMRPHEATHRDGTVRAADVLWKYSELPDPTAIMSLLKLTHAQLSDLTDYGAAVMRALRLEYLVSQGLFTPDDMPPINTTIAADGPVL